MRWTLCDIRVYAGVHVLRCFRLVNYGQFGELEDWWPKLLSSVRRTESKESEFTKSSSAIWSAANWATKISSAALLLISHSHQYWLQARSLFAKSGFGVWKVPKPGFGSGSGLVWVWQDGDRIQVKPLMTLFAICSWYPLVDELILSAS